MAQKKSYASVLFSFRYTGQVVKDVMNLGSYNYLGFAENKGTCATAAGEVTVKFGVGVASTRQEMGERLLLLFGKYLDVNVHKAHLSFKHKHATHSMYHLCY